jgi:hypothetical protein
MTACLNTPFGNWKQRTRDALAAAVTISETDAKLLPVKCPTMERPVICFVWFSLIFVTGFILFAPFERTLTFSQDDAFFYFEVARRIGSGQGTTFDGITQTNGYHPLWQCLLVPLAPLMNASRELGARVALVFSVVLMGLALLQIHRVAQRLTPGKAWMGLLYVTMTLVWAPIYGMESALAALLLAILLNLIVNEATLTSVPTGMKIGFVSALLMLARLDALMYLVAVDSLWAVLLWRLHHSGKRSWCPWFWCLAIQMTLIGLYFAYNQIAYGHLLTISALVKAGRFHGINTAWLFRPLSFVALLNLVLGGLAIREWRGKPGSLTLQVALMGSMLTMLEIALRGTFETLVWYHTLPAFCGAIFVSALFVNRSARLMRVLPLGIALSLFAALTFLQAVWSRIHHRREPRYEKAVWMSTHSPANAVFAMPDSGILGYRSERSVIDTDGLTCNFAFQNAIHDDTLPAWLTQVGVNTIVTEPRQRIVKTCEGRFATDLVIWEGMYGEQRHVHAMIQPVCAQRIYRLWNIVSIHNGSCTETDTCTKQAQ